MGVRSPDAASARKWSAARRRGRVEVGMPGRILGAATGAVSAGCPAASGYGFGASWIVSGFGVGLAPGLAGGAFGATGSL